MDNRRILAIDDETAILDVVRAYLEREHYQVVTATDGLSGLRQFHSWAPDLVILDLMLPDMSGEDVCRGIRAQSNIPIIMLTAKIDQRSIEAGFRLGTDDYLTKPFSPRELVLRIAAILRRGVGEPTVACCSVDARLSLNAASHSAEKDGRPLGLTPTEFKLLQLFLNHPERAFSRDELADRTLGQDFDGFDRTIDAHIKNLRHKVEDDPHQPNYILTVHGVGYRFAKTRAEPRS